MGNDGREKSHSDKPRGREVEKRKKVLKLFKGTVNQWQPLPDLPQLRPETKVWFYLSGISPFLTSEPSL